LLEPVKPLHCRPQGGIFFSALEVLSGGEILQANSPFFVPLSSLYFPFPNPSTSQRFRLAPFFSPVLCSFPRVPHNSSPMGALLPFCLLVYPVSATRRSHPTAQFSSSKSHASLVCRFDVASLFSFYFSFRPPPPLVFKLLPPLPSSNFRRAGLASLFFDSPPTVGPSSSKPPARPPPSSPPSPILFFRLLWAGLHPVIDLPFYWGPRS